MWNYRVVKAVYNHKYLHEPETLYQIREVYYDKNGKINGIAQTAEISSDSLDGLKFTLRKMIESLEKRTVDYKTGTEIDE